MASFLINLVHYYLFTYASDFLVEKAFKNANKTVPSVGGPSGRKRSLSFSEVSRDFPSQRLDDIKRGRPAGRPVEGQEKRLLKSLSGRVLLRAQELFLGQNFSTGQAV